MFKSVVLFISLSSLLSIGWYVFGESLLDSMRPSSLSPIDRHNPIDEIGVGFDLTLSYGTASLSFPEGYTQAVAKVEATEEYHELVHRLSLPSSQHPAPPYDNFDDYFRDLPRQRQRKARKAVGLPASDDVAVIGKMLKTLRREVEDLLNRPISSAVIVAPNILALYEEDLVDAFEWIGLKYIDVAYINGVIYETHAAYAGYGFGLCANYTDPEVCHHEELAMDRDRVLSVLFTNSALFVGNDVLANAYWLWEPQHRVKLNFSLGYDNPLGMDEYHYFKSIGENLRANILNWPKDMRPNKVLLQGECASKQNFKQILNISLLDLIKDLWDNVYMNDTIFVNSKGAAEFAKRMLWDRSHNGTWSPHRPKPPVEQSVELK